MRSIVGYLLLLPLLFLILFLLPSHQLPRGGGQTVEKILIRQPEVARDGELFDGEWKHGSKFERPGPDDQPTQVRVGFYIFDVHSIDDANQTVTVAFKLFLHWKDPLLAFDERKTKILPLQAVWNPFILLVNALEVNERFDQTVFVTPSGHVFYSQDFVGKFSAPLNLSNYPFDQHEIFINLRSFFGPEEVEFVIDESVSNWENRLSLPDWKITDGTINVTSNTHSLSGRETSQITLSFVVERYLGFYLWRVILPISLIVFLSWGIFWMDPNEIQPKFVLVGMSFLTLFAFQFVISTYMPKISYLTRLDWFVFGCTFMLFLAVLESLVVNYYLREGEFSTAARYDYLSRYLFPILFAVLFVFSFY